MDTRWTWRDSGIRSARGNLGLDRLAHRDSGESGQLRFHRFTPSVLIGAHEDSERVSRVDYCKRHGIEVARRLTGGGALYLDDRQLCWSLTLPSAKGRAAGASLAEALERLCVAVADALCSLGVRAAFRACNDIEVDGRKIACGFLGDDGRRMVFQGTLLLEVDVETMLKALRVPTEKLSAQGMVSARERFTTLCQQLGSIPPLSEIESRITQAFGALLGVDFSFSPCASYDHAEPPAGTAILPRPVSSGTFHAFHRTAGGVLHAEVDLAGGETEIASVHLSGSIQLSPPDLLMRIERSLAGQDTGQSKVLLDQFLGAVDWEMVGATAQDLGYVLQLAINHQREQVDLGVEAAAANLLMVHSPGQNQVLGDILSRATVMLVPYCAKPLWCKWRFRDGCTECGRCEVGEAYRLARDRGMQVISINNYEHLRETLGRIQEEGAEAYVGMCCGNFYLKRHVAFDETCIPAVLMDISGANCYELRQEDLAYAGTFQAQSQLNIELLRKVVALIPDTRGEKS